MKGREACQIRRKIPNLYLIRTPHAQEPLYKWGFTSPANVKAKFKEFNSQMDRKFS